MTDQIAINQIFIRTAIGTGFIFLMTTLGAATVFLIPGEPRRTSREIMYGFASGVMTAASVWSLLLPAMERTEQSGVMPGWLPAVIGMILGAAFLAIPDRCQSSKYQYKNYQNQDALLIAAGAMLYAVQRELSPRASGYAGTCAYLAGFFIMMALDNAL